MRYAAHRTRRLSLKKSTRERWLLTLYMPLGYGERIIAPLLWLVILSIVVTLLIIGNGGPGLPGHELDFAHLWVGVLGSPLEFFRFTKAPQVVGAVDSIPLLVMRAVGLFLMILALFAARKVVRAE